MNPDTAADLPLRPQSRANRDRFWPADGNHPIENFAGNGRLSFLRLRMTSAKSVANNRLGSKEGVLDSGLAMIPRPAYFFFFFSAFIFFFCFGLS